jgi:hypothetical protein
MSMVNTRKSKMLSSIIQDGLAIEAFHNEQRHLLARQEERNKQDRMNENSHKRFQQMQHKPWIKRILESQLHHVFFPI